MAQGDSICSSGESLFCEVEAKVGEETETRPIRASEPVSRELPRIRPVDLD